MYVGYITYSIHVPEDQLVHKGVSQGMPIFSLIKGLIVVVKPKSARLLIIYKFYPYHLWAVLYNPLEHATLFCKSRLYSL
jgi:hypothetical protein